MSKIKLDISNIYNTVSSEDIHQLKQKSELCNNKLHNKTGPGSDFLGWLDINSFMPEELLRRINNTAKTFAIDTECIVVIGIGGSYLGSKAIINSLKPAFIDYANSENPEILYAGINLCEDFLHELIEYLENKSFKIIVISKSGTTTEPAISFRILKEYVIQRYGKDEIANRIIAITDKRNGGLRAMADQEAYSSFIIPENIGGRYSVLTAVGLFPIACAGYNIYKIIEGALQMQSSTSSNIPHEENIASLYSASRNLLYSKGKNTEILVNYNPKLHDFAEWWKQLFGESEGKNNSGIFPSNADFTTDLHSLGQYIQEGTKNIFETVISVEKQLNELRIPYIAEDTDKINYIANKRISEVNKKAEEGTRLAHIDGDVPNIIIGIPELNEFYIGQLIYFFEKSCALSGYLMGINPFDQPGVEAYKKNMFKLLGRI